jgi:methylmalonyl-CoA mutase N-terminal domain/subunit
MATEPVTRIESEEAPRPGTRDAKTSSGIPLRAVYGPQDAAGMDYDRDIGDPGAYPFTRGTRASGYRAKKWTVRQVMGLGTGEETNARLRHLLREGQTGISLTGLGYASFESSDPRAAALVGRGGVWVDTLADMEDVFREIPIERLSINQTGNSIPAFAMIVGVARRRGIALDQLSGTIQNYVLPWGKPPRYEGNHYIDLIEFCAKRMPRWNHTSISVRNTRESGIGADQEIAFGIYEGWYAASTGAARGAEPNRVGRGLTFFLNAENELLEEVAKFRAMRRLWARVMRERLGASDDRACQLRFHVQTSGVALTAQQPLNNIVRATIHALAAALGGAQSMSVNAFDEGAAIPSQFAQTLSVRTQQIIALESGLASVVDPLGGSWAIESLTNELERRATRIFESMTRMAATEAWEYVSTCSREAAYRRQLEIDREERPLVGVNCFEDEDDGDLEFARSMKKLAPDYDPAWREKQIRRLERVKRERDSGRFEAARRRLAEAYRLREPIVEPVLEAAEAYLSIGEMVSALVEVSGETEVRKRGGFITRLY